MTMLSWLRPELVQTSASVIASLFKLIGWIFTKEGKKAKPLDNSCKALVVVFEVSQSPDRNFFVKNTAERVDELKTDILAILSAGFTSEAKARSLQTRGEGKIFLEDFCAHVRYWIPS